MIGCMLMHNLPTLTSYKPFTNLPLAFLLFNKLNTTSKCNNLRFIPLIMLSDFIQVLNSAWDVYTKN
jgi:hypothetical protein